MPESSPGIYFITPKSDVVLDFPDISLKTRREEGSKTVLIEMTEITFEKAVQIMQAYFPPIMGLEEATELWYGDGDRPENWEAFIEAFISHQHLVIMSYREIPCGWYFTYNSKPYAESVECGTPDINSKLIGGGHAIVNKWSGECQDFWGSDFLNVEAAIRYYIDQLPSELRELAYLEWDKMPYAPIRFFPPVIRFRDSISLTQFEDMILSVEFDFNFFSSRRKSIPDLYFSSSKYNDIKGKSEEFRFQMLLVSSDYSKRDGDCNLIRNSYKFDTGQIIGKLGSSYISGIIAIKVKNKALLKHDLANFHFINVYFNSIMGM